MKKNEGRDFFFVWNLAQGQKHSFHLCGQITKSRFPCSQLVLWKFYFISKIWHVIVCYLTYLTLNSPHMQNKWQQCLHSYAQNTHLGRNCNVHVEHFLDVKAQDKC
jgi:hypothetical protein